MKLAILGTRGIPNHYGGFEQFAEYLSLGLVKKGHDVWVYNSSLHPYKREEWNGVNLVKCKDWEDKLGTAGQFFYDLNCILDSRKRGFDIILQLGYTSSSIWGFLFPKKSIIVTNMDGLEWKRSKYNRLTKSFLKKAERWAIKSSDHLVSDSIGIQTYLEETLGAKSSFIAYGSNLFQNPDNNTLNDFSVQPFDYYLIIARMEPENNIELILDAYVKSNFSKDFLVVGKTNNSFGKYLVSKYSNTPKIRFLGGIYDIDLLNNLRFYCKLYFHGHSVGGTNPSLLEAMASSALIVAHDNPFNKAILNDDAFYFNDIQSCEFIFNLKVIAQERAHFIEENRKKILNEYNWTKIIATYETLFTTLVN
tara:strand:- start:4467 stop:5558 length:1092 start_codon:yes stop_codon:yes gene_type:complete